MHRDRQGLAQHEDQGQAFAQRFTALREAHLRKPSLIARFDRARLTLLSVPAETGSWSGTHLRLVRALGGRSRRLPRYLRRVRRISGLPG